MVSCFRKLCIEKFVFLLQNDKDCFQIGVKPGIKSPWIYRFDVVNLGIFELLVCECEFQ